MITTDGGVSWELVEGFSDSFSRSAGLVWGRNTQSYFVVGAQTDPTTTPDFVFSTTDGGQSFSKAPFGDGYRAIWGYQSWVFIVVNIGLDSNGSAFNGFIYRSADGVSWVPVHNGTTFLRGIWGTDSGSVIYVVGDGGLVLRSLDGGLQWEPVNVGTTNRLHAVWGSSETDVYVVGDSVVIHGQ